MKDSKDRTWYVAGTPAKLTLEDYVKDRTWDPNKPREVKEGSLRFEPKGTAVDPKAQIDKLTKDFGNIYFLRARRVAENADPKLPHNVIWALMPVAVYREPDKVEK